MVRLNMTIFYRIQDNERYVGKSSRAPAKLASLTNHHQRSKHFKHTHQGITLIPLLGETQ